MFKSMKNKAVSLSRAWIGYSAIKEQHSQIKKMASVLKPKSIKQIREESRCETFEEAKTRLKVTNKDISKNYYNYMYMFYFSLLMLTVCFVMLVKYLYIDQQLMPNILGFIGVSVLFAAASVRYSFLCYQIKNKTLCSFNKFLDSSSIFPLLLGDEWYKEGDGND